MSDSIDVKLLETLPSEDLESAIVKAARISFSQSTKSAKEDSNLIKFLYRNKHTSPFEMVRFKFYVKCPIFVARQILRHRTANVNEFSERYAEVKFDFFPPSKEEDGIRLKNSGANKQSSELGIIPKELSDKVKEVESKLESIFDDYQQLLDLGMAKESARFCLPLATYTEFLFCMDLHNLIKFLRLRMDIHTQLETRKVANKMFELIKDKVPVTISCYLEEKNLFSLTKEELVGLRNNDKEVKFESRSQQEHYLRLFDIE